MRTIHSSGLGLGNFLQSWSKESLKHLKRMKLKSSVMKLSVGFSVRSLGIWDEFSSFFHFSIRISFVGCYFFSTVVLFNGLAFPKLWTETLARYPDVLS